MRKKKFTGSYAEVDPKITFMQNSGCGGGSKQGGRFANDTSSLLMPGNAKILLIGKCINVIKFLYCLVLSLDHDNSKNTTI